MIARPGVILAIDQACRAGIAVNARGAKRPVGSTFQVKAAGDDYGPVLLAFEANVLELLAVHAPDAVVYEAPLVIGGRSGTTRPTNEHAIRLLFGFTSVIEMSCARRGLRPDQVHQGHIQSVRRHFCGNGRATKDDVIARCNALGWRAKSDDEADAMALWDYARHCLAGKVAA